MDVRAPTILVVDDDSDVRMMIGTALRRAGYQPTLVSTVPAALASLATTAYAVVMTDYCLATSSGRPILAAVQQMARRPALILMTGHSEAMLAEELVGLPITAFLAKPFALTVLYDLLVRCLAADQLVRAVREDADARIAPQEGQG